MLDEPRTAQKLIGVIQKNAHYEIRLGEKSPKFNDWLSIRRRPELLLHKATSLSVVEEGSYFFYRSSLLFCLLLPLSLNPNAKLRNLFFSKKKKTFSKSLRRSYSTG